MTSRRKPPNERTVWICPHGHSQPFEHGDGFRYMKGRHCEEEGCGLLMKMTRMKVGPRQHHKHHK
jgi:hypothetical protein